MFQKRSGQFGDQAITKALCSQRCSNCLLSFPQKQFPTLIRNLPSVKQHGGLSLQCLSLINSFSGLLSLHQLKCLYFKTQRPHKFQNCYRYLKYKCYRCTVVPPFIKMYKTHLPLLSSDVHDSAAAVYGPTFSCLVPLPLPIHCRWFVVWSSCVYRSVASTDEMKQHCITGTQNSCVPHHITQHITSHHTTSRHITSHNSTSHHTTAHHITPRHVTSHHTTTHHITSHHNTLQVLLQNVYTGPQNFTLYSLSKANGTFFTVKLNYNREPRSANFPARFSDNLPKILTDL